MAIIRKESCSECQGEKKAYEPPRAMRLGEMRNGAGACISSGSGDGDFCEGSGNSASGGCYGSGNDY